MSKLIIHLGYPKTGTTYLQRKIFSQLTDEFVIITPEFENIGINIRRFKHMIQNGEVPKGLAENLAEKNVLISIEGWLFDPMRNVSDGTFSPVSFPKALEGLRLLSSGFNEEDISIVICLRRQDNLMHSLYAESKTFHFNQCEKLNTFEKYVEAVINEDKTPQQPGYYYNFNNTLLEIKDAFSKCNVHVRFYENLERNPAGEVEFWSKVCDSSLETVVGRENARVASENVKVTDQGGWLRFHVLRLKNKYAPGLKLPNQVSRFLKAVLIKTTSVEQEKIIITEENKEKLFLKYTALNANSPVSDLVPDHLKMYYCDLRG